MSILDGVQRVLLCHAHPDDETLATGALIVHLRSRGIACDVLTSSRGEEGEVVPGPLSYLEGTANLHARREEELAGALRVLDVERHAFLGTPPARAGGCAPRTYRDSGMQWIRPGVAGPADTSDERNFVAADPQEETADLHALVRAWQPDLLITYDAHGGYGHPDHVRMHEITGVVGRELGIRVAEVRHEEGDGVEWFSLFDTLPIVVEALRHHATQLTVQDDGTHVVHSGGQREKIVTSVGLAHLQGRNAR